MNEIEVRGEYITLGQLLKLSGIAGAGGDVKWYLAQSPVFVNGEAEDRRGRKLRPGDTVRLSDGTEIRLSEGS